MDILSVFHSALQKCGRTRKNRFYEDKLVDVRDVRARTHVTCACVRVCVTQRKIKVEP